MQSRLVTLVTLVTTGAALVTALFLGAAWVAAHEVSGSHPFGELKPSPAPEDARVYFISPENGDEVARPLTVRFGLEGMGVAPAGMEHHHTGHHHVLIDVDLPTPGQPIPADDQHRHFGGGQTEVSLKLKPGPHTLQLILGDHRHVPFEPALVSERITVTVR